MRRQPMKASEPVYLDHVFYFSSRVLFNCLLSSENFHLRDSSIKLKNIRIEVLLVKQWESLNYEITDEKLKK